VFVVLVITVAIMSPIATLQFATSRNHRLEWAIWVTLVVVAGSHIETWRLANSSNLTFIVAMFGFLFAVYEIMVVPAIFVLILENKDKHHKDRD